MLSEGLDTCSGGECGVVYEQRFVRPLAPGPQV